jgi:hypothetical protein
MHPIEVTARFGLDGQIHPLRFIWKDQVYPIESTGRRWTDEAGLHLLVLTPGGMTFELCFAPPEARWFVREIGPLKTSA